MIVSSLFFCITTICFLREFKLGKNEGYIQRFYYYVGGYGGGLFFLYMFVIDGRQPEYSNGMLLEDMMLLCQGAGCYQALNLDGGGSTTMVRRVEQAGSPVSFEIMNTPSDVPSRAVLNGLQVIEKNN